MMTVYWGRLSEALSHWNKSCLVDFFHCSKNIPTHGCDTKVREEQHTVPIWMLQRTPEISTAMNISGKTSQHSLPSFNRKKIIEFTLIAVSDFQSYPSCKLVCGSCQPSKNNFHQPGAGTKWDPGRASWFAKPRNLRAVKNLERLGTKWTQGADRYKWSDMGPLSLKSATGGFTMSISFSNCFLTSRPSILGGRIKWSWRQLVILQEAHEVSKTLKEHPS